LGPMAAHVKSLRTRCIIQFFVNANVHLHPPLSASDSTAPVSSSGNTASDYQLKPGPAAGDQRRRRTYSVSASHAN
jgi:hypothetical protein